MYHCKIDLYLIGISKDLLKKVEETLPLPHFTHEFAESDTPEERLLSKADVIMIDMSGRDVEETLSVLHSCKKKDAEVILLVKSEQTEPLLKKIIGGEDGCQITDIWLMPLTEDELCFRFRKWQETYKMSKDFWQNRNYLDSMINSVPHMIWYKDKEGAHIKVNDLLGRKRYGDSRRCH